MNIGPLEYVVIGVPNQELKQALFEELNDIQVTGKIRLVDLVFVTKAADGRVTMQEMSDLDETELAVYPHLADNLKGLLSEQDIEPLKGQIPLNSSAVVILFEHAWVIGLTEVIRNGGGMVFSVGMVTHEALAQVNAELAKAQEAQHA